MTQQHETAGPFPPMERRRIGRNGLAVSVLGLGAAPLGGLYTPVSEQDACETVAEAATSGINYFDVAPHYGQGLAERRLGQGLARLPQGRCVVSTKVGRLLEPSPQSARSATWPEALPFTTIYDVSRAGILRSIADSRARVGRASFDILLLHDPDRHADDRASLTRMLAEAHRTLVELRDSGEVRAIGIGVNAPLACHIALDLGSWDCFLLAGSYSVLRQDEAGLFARCLNAGTSVLVGGPFMSGALAGGSTWQYRAIPSDIAADIARLQAVCHLHGVPIVAAALQFPLLHPAVATVVTGMRSATEVRSNVQMLHHPIPAAFWHAVVAEGFASEECLPALCSIPPAANSLSRPALCPTTPSAEDAHADAAPIPNAPGTP